MDKQLTIARGGIVTGEELRMVGEKPELLQIPKGSRVLSLNEVKTKLGTDRRERPVVDKFLAVFFTLIPQRVSDIRANRKYVGDLSSGTYVHHKVVTYLWLGREWEIVLK